MGKHGNKREKLSETTSPKGGHQHPRRRSSSSYYGMWSLLIIVIVAAAAVAWSVFKDDSPSSTAADPASDLLNASLPTKADPKLVEPIPESVSAVARLEIPEPEFDFGFVPQNSKVSHVFWLHSAGTDTLKIVKVNPG